MNLEEIDVNLFKIFYYVCQYGTFSKTAEALGVTQPSVSYSIKTLETQLGIKLFERSSYSLTLTSEGEMLLPYVEQSLNSLKTGMININDLVNLNSGQISIGVPSHIGVFLLTDIISEFTKEYPNIKIKVISKPTKELFRLLNNNELEVLIDSSPLDNSFNNVEIYKIATENCILACNRKMTELRDKKISLKKVLNYPLIVPLRTSSSTKELMRIFEKNKIPFNPSYEISTSDMIAEMIEKNLGVGYLFEKTIALYDNICKIDLNITLPTFDIYIIYKDKIPSVTAKKFISFVKNRS